MAPRKAGNAQQKQDSNTTSSGKQKVKFNGYVNYTPTEQDKHELRELLAAGHDLLDELYDEVADNYKLSIMWDSYHQSFAATLYAMDANCVNAGWTLSQRANDPWSAVSRLLYVHLRVFERDWTSAISGAKKVDEWDN